MSVSKTLRYEILRRDDHTCRYCGATAPDITLTVDHVLPTALGGSDAPDNLVAACTDCNAGKAASNPGSPLVDQVSDTAIEWAKNIQAAALVLSIELAELQDTRGAFNEIWCQWRYGSQQQPVPRPPNWCDTIDMLSQRGLPLDVMEECVRIAMTRSHIRTADTFKYFCGVAWKKISEITSLAKSTPNQEGTSSESVLGIPSVTFAETIVDQVVTALGGTLETNNLANDALWTGSQKAHDAYTAEIHTGADTDQAECVAKEALSAAIAPILRHLSAISGAPDLPAVVGEVR